MKGPFGCFSCIVFYDIPLVCSRRAEDVHEPVFIIGSEALRIKFFFFCTFAAQFIKSCTCMNSEDKRMATLDVLVKNWGPLENWKSTASPFRLYFLKGPDGLVPGL